MHVCRCRRAREREKLQSLISELDQLAVEVDPATLLRNRKPRTRVSLATLVGNCTPNQVIVPQTTYDTWSVSMIVVVSVHYGVVHCQPPSQASISTTVQRISLHVIRSVTSAVEVAVQG